MASSIREITMPSFGEPLVESGDPGKSIALVTTEADWIATLTFGASTVRLIGPGTDFRRPDEGGHHRFISSRKTHNGPILGDVGGRSILDDTGDRGAFAPLGSRHP
jgi:hypothetical protein